MKTVLTKFLAIGSLSLLLLISCKKDSVNVATNGGKPGTLSASTTTPVLSKNNLNDTTAVVSFKFTPPDYGYSAAVTNTLQIDLAGDNWAKPTSVTLSGKQLTQGYSTADFNAMLLKLNLTGGVSSQVQVRVQHSIGTSLAPVYSNVVTLNVTPFNLASYLYTVGAYQGWNINSQDSILSATSNGIYVGVFNFPADKNDFLIVPGKKSYDNKYATNDPQKTTSSNVVIGGANNFYAPATGGFYKVTLNLNTNKIAFDATTTYYSVVGDGAKGWPNGDDISNDVDMKSANDGTGSWSVTLDLKSTGKIKIRKGHAWSTSYGVPKTGADGKTLASSDNDDIPVPATGTYKITFLPAADEKTAAFTLVKQ